MKNEAIYGAFGQVLVAALLALLACSLYWSWNALCYFTRNIVGDELSVFVALLSVVAMVTLARWNVAVAMLIFLALAGIDRLFLADTNPFLNSLWGSVCLVFASVTAIGILSERLKWAQNHFPSVLMVVLGIVFLAPVAVIAKLLQVIGVIPKSSGE